MHMRVLSIDQNYRIIGGKERYAIEFAKILTDNHNTVVPFSVADNRNLPSDFSAYFAPPLDVDSPYISRRIIAGIARAYSIQARRSLRQLLNQASIDVAHIHTLFHLSSSVVHELRKHNKPIVWTLHDYKLICPVAILFVDGSPCVRCKRHRYYETVLHKCSHQQLTSSIACALDSYTTYLLQVTEFVYRFIAPSQFIRDKFVEFGWDARKLVHIPHFAPINQWDYVPPQSKGPIVFIGRLYEQKGVHVLLHALAKLNLPSNQQVIIAGDGPELPHLQLLARELGLSDLVQFTGYISYNTIRLLIERSYCYVVPSIWYEVFGLSILEAYAVGRPVIASAIGGIPEIVTDGAEGKLCHPNDVDSLTEQLDWMLSNPHRAAEMGQAARARAKNDFSPNRHYDSIMSLYHDAIQQAS